MLNNKKLDVIIVGGSFAGLAAAMALGRALRTVAIIDSGMPCNQTTPASHNFLTQDGKSPGDIASIARQQVLQYNTIDLYNGVAKSIFQNPKGFDVTNADGTKLSSRKVIFATGIKDVLPSIPGFAACWGKSVLHCPYCHGYEVREQPTGILANGDAAYELTALISNWTSRLSLLTNGKSTLTELQTQKIRQHGIAIFENEIAQMQHEDGNLQQVVFRDGTSIALKALYARLPFEQHCILPKSLGAEFGEDGYLKVDASYKTTVDGVFACGDSTSRMRTVANAVSSGTTAGMMVNKELINEDF
ncbi:MAG TPA: NAD(P)/FAD-dependent oxidoreductase [Chryseosolibacter sp.]